MTSNTAFATGYAGNYSVTATTEYQTFCGDAPRASSSSGYQYIPPIGLDIGLIGMKLNGTAGTNREVWIDSSGSNVLDYIAPTLSGGVQRGTSYYTASSGQNLSFGTKSSSGTFSNNSWVGVVKTTSSPVSIYCASANPGAAYSVSNSSRRFGLYGGVAFVAASSNNSQVVMKTSGSFLRGQINVSANTRAVSTTFTLFKNGSATSMAVTFSALETGSKYSDTVVSYTDGDRFDWSVSSGVDTNTITITASFLTAQTTSGQKSDLFARPATSVTLSGSATASYIPITGRPAANNTENTKEFTFGFPCRLSNFRALVTASAGYNGTLTIRKNGVDTSLSLSIPSGTSGDYSDLVNTLDLVAGDVITVKRTGGTSGSIILSTLGVTVEDLTPPVDGSGGEYIEIFRRRRFR